MILSCHHISKSFLEVPVLTDVTFHLEKGEKAAIVGINGAGKSTLLKIITGEMKSDEGTVSVSKDTALGYLAQNQNLSSGRTIYEELLDVRRDIVEMEDKIARDDGPLTVRPEVERRAQHDAFLVANGIDAERTPYPERT